MSQVSELELQNIRHLVLNSDMDINNHTKAITETNEDGKKNFS